ncbi:hypothetical protein GCM10010341_40050 [Streptomyces noursei]|nr:hypothetical protein GCM10010341_40050 [Streptomyces noursei]
MVGAEAGAGVEAGVTVSWVLVRMVRPRRADTGVFFESAGMRTQLLAEIGRGGTGRVG